MIGFIIAQSLCGIGYADEPLDSAIEPIVLDSAESAFEAIIEPSLKSSELIDDDSFLTVMNLEIEQGQISQTATEMQNWNTALTFLNSDSIDESVYTTAPTVAQSSSLKIVSNAISGIRYSATVSAEQRAVATEYGILVAVTSSLEASGKELTFDLKDVLFITGVAYDITDGTDLYYSINEDGSYTINYAGTNIPQMQYNTYLTARSYIKYNIDGVETTVYGNSYSSSVYRTSKSTIAVSTDNIEIELAKSAIEYVDNSVSLTIAENVIIEDVITRTIGMNPDVDLVKFIPETTGCYTFTYEATDGTVFEILDSDGSIMNEVEFGVSDSAYIFESGQNYYLRVKGNPNEPYSVEAQLVYNDALVWEFDSGTEGFYFDQDASNGGITDSKLTVAINKTSNSSNFNAMAYMSKGGLSIDLLNYSKIIIRLKNCTSATNLQWYFKIDSDYDGSNSASWYQPNVVMSSNMAEYQYIEFDLSLRHGLLKSLMIGFGKGGEELVGNIFIDSISFIPMPNVYGWEFNENTENWLTNERISSSEIVNGTYMLEMLGHDEDTCTDSAIYLHSSNIGISTEKYNKVQISIKNMSDATEMEVYFATYTEGQEGFSENRCISVNIEPNSSDFIEYTFDLVPEDYWHGIFKKMMVSIHGEGTAFIDYIRFAEFDIDYPDIIWDFEDDTAQGFIVSDNNSGTYQHQIEAENGSLVVTRISNGNGGVFTPDKLKLPTDEYRYLILGVNSATTDAEFKVYFDTTDMYYAENDEVNRIINTRSVKIKKSDTYREYAIDLAAVESGWTTNYCGNLNQLMFSLKADGSFEFDYIKLSSGEELYYESFEFYSSESEKYNIMVLKSNEAFEIGSYTILYNPQVLTLTDTCTFTSSKNLELGRVVGSDIFVTSIQPGEITFYTSKKINNGFVNCLEFIAKDSCTTQITLLKHEYGRKIS